MSTTTTHKMHSISNLLVVALSCLLWSTDVSAFIPQHLQQKQKHRALQPSTFLSSPAYHTTSSNVPSRRVKLSLSSNAENDNTGAADSSIDISVDPRLYRVRIARYTGIEWGTDLSFSFVYVRNVDPSGPAYGIVNVGDQLCELRAARGGSSSGSETTTTTTPAAVNLVGATFDYAMTAFAELDKNVEDVELVFFRGTKQELQALCEGVSVDQPTKPITITVIQDKGSPQEVTRILQAPQGCNLRKVLVEDHGINVYQSITRWTNCKGKQLCGTCIVNVVDGSRNTNWKSMDEASTLRENPESYRLSCVTFCYGDVTVETFPPVNPAQWTR